MKCSAKYQQLTGRSISGRRNTAFLHDGKREGTGGQVDAVRAKYKVKKVFRIQEMLQRLHPEQFIIPP